MESPLFLLPDELFCIIMTYVNFRLLIDLFKICRRLYETKELEDIFSRKLSSVTGLDLSKYTRNQMIRLSLIYNKKHISAGRNHSLMLDEMGYFYCFGGNYCGELGFLIDDNDDNYINSPISMKIEGITSVYAGTSRSLMLDKNGSVYSFGDNEFGYLGLDSDAESIPQPTKIESLKSIIITKASCGSPHSLLLDISGNVYSFGYNRYGELGLGHNDNRSVPVLIENISNIVDICAGTLCSFLLNDKGKVLTCGKSCFGSFTVPTLIPNLEDIIQISSYTGTYVFLDTNGQVYLFDDESNSNTKIPNVNNIVQIAAGVFCLLLLDRQGNVYHLSRRKFTKRKSLKTIFSLILVPDVANIIQISSNAYHALLLNNEGYVYSFGNNTDGKLGLGIDSEDILMTPSRIPDFQIYPEPPIVSPMRLNLDCLTISSLRKIFRNFRNSEEMILREQLQKIANIEKYTLDELKRICSISGGLISSCDEYILQLNDNGRITAIKDSENLLVNNVKDIIQISYPLLLNNKGDIRVLDDNEWAASSHTLNNIIQISSGENFALALDFIGNVHTIGIDTNCPCGEIHPSQTVPLSNIKDIIQISAGHHHSLLLSNKGQVYSFGNNIYGQLGLGDNINRLNPILIMGLENIVQISAGDGHSLALNNKEEVYGFGCNNFGQLVTTDKTDKLSPILITNDVIQISAGVERSLFLHNDGIVDYRGKSKYDNFKIKSENIIEVAVDYSYYTIDIEGKLTILEL